MTIEQKKALLGFGLGALILWAGLKLFKKPEVLPDVHINDAGIGVAVAAYKEMLEAGEDHAALNQLNETLVREYGVRVGLRDDGKFSILNNKGVEIRIVS